MSTSNNHCDPLFKDGTYVKILHSGYHRARIAEYRGPLGPNGAHVYRVLVGTKPRRDYIEVLENQLEAIERPNKTPATET